MTLARRLLDRLGDRGKALPAAGALEPMLATLVEQARGRLEHAPVAAEDFVDRLADCVAAGGVVDLAALERVRTGELYLALALARGDKRAIAIAEAELVPEIRKAIAKVDGTPAFVDEVTQRVRDKLFVGDAPAIAGYRASGPLARWVRVVGSRMAIDDKRKTSDASDDGLDRIPAPDDPELELVWRECADQYKAALAVAFAELDKRDRNLLRQRYVDDLNIDAIGRLYRVHPATAFRWLRQIEQRLGERTRASLMEKLSVTASQVASMERLVASQLRISLTKMLRVKPR
jgi:RNA polymerase sigma-70 factor, ECF subfamily